MWSLLICIKKLLSYQIGINEKYTHLIVKL
jgi:hypothetical protein